MKNKMEITASEAAEKLGMKQQTVSYWLGQNLVDMRGYERQHGAHVPIGPKQMRELETIKGLRDAGASLQAIRRAALNLRTRGHNPFSTGKFAVLNGEIIRISEGNDQAVGMLKNPGAGYMVKLIVEEEPES